MREHNTPAVAPIASLHPFDGKGHAGDPKVGIKPPAPRQNGIGDLLRDVQYRTFDGITDGVNNIAIDTPPVPADMYWVLLGASGTAAATIPGYAIFLMPPQFKGSPAPVVNDKFAHSGVRIDSGLNIAAIDRRIIVPPGWFLRLLRRKSKCGKQNKSGKGEGPRSTPRLRRQLPPRSHHRPHSLKKIRISS